MNDLLRARGFFRARAFFRGDERMGPNGRAQGAASLIVDRNQRGGGAIELDFPNPSVPE